MHDQPSEESAAQAEERIDRSILRLVLEPTLRAPLSEAEVERELGGGVLVEDSLARLAGAGLIHRCGEFLFSTAAARRFDVLLDGAVETMD